MTGLRSAVGGPRLRRLPVLRLSGLVAWIVLTVFLHVPAGAEQKMDERINCDIQSRPCTRDVAGCKVTLDIGPRPVKAMEDLAFTVNIEGKKPEAAPYIDLGMPGMNMGKNRVELTAAGQGTYEGKGVIVRCPSGRQTWRARVTVPGSGEAEFVFHVVY